MEDICVVDNIDEDVSLLTHFMIYQLIDCFYQTKNIVEFSEDSFVIVKPIEAKNWHPAMAIKDSHKVLNAVLLGKEGVARFVTEKYSSYYGRNIMLGFVVKKIDVSSNAKLIEEIQNAELDQHMHGDFQLVKSEGVTKSYKCMYQIQSGEVELRHIFSDYSSIMS